mgnify:CR=1 FL=1
MYVYLFLSYIRHQTIYYRLLQTPGNSIQNITISNVLFILYLMKQTYVTRDQT